MSDTDLSIPDRRQSNIFMVITNEQVYDLVNQVKDAVEDLATVVKPIPSQIIDHETRLRHLEKAAWAIGGVATIAFVGLLERLITPIIN